jgi:hypothetical protein
MFPFLHICRPADSRSPPTMSSSPPNAMHNRRWRHVYFFLRLSSISLHLTIQRARARTSTFVYIYVNTRTCINTHTHTRVDDRTCRHRANAKCIVPRARLCSVFFSNYIPGTYNPISNTATTGNRTKFLLYGRKSLF